MPSPVFFLLLATLLPLVGFGLLLAMGKRFGSPLAGVIATVLITGSFACTMVAMVKWYDGSHGGVAWGKDQRPLIRNFHWLPGAAHTRHTAFRDISIYVDSLTIAMFALITLTALLAHLFSIGLLRATPNFSRFFAWLGFLCFAMLAMVLSGSLLPILICWELLGLCSSLLIGFWIQNRAASRAALHTFIIQRIGDCGLLAGFILLINRLGNSPLPRLWTLLGGVADGQSTPLNCGNVTPAMLTLVGIALFVGIIAQCAQFPLHRWLADTAHGPAPAIALIQTSATVAAGIYLLGRLFPILTPDARLFIAIIGLITLMLGALISMVQRDILRLLGWSTVSQLGYMTLALGLGSWVGGLFHLMAHAFVKLLLILAAAGAVAAIGRGRDLRVFGGLWRKLPITAGIFAVGAMALAGAPFLSMHYSQATILTDAAAFAGYAAHTHGRSGIYWLFFIVPLAMCAVSAFAITRGWMLIFAGPSRDQDIESPPDTMSEFPASTITEPLDAIRREFESTTRGAVPQLQSRPREQVILWGPLLVLAALSVIAGYLMNVPELLQSSIVETRGVCDDFLARVCPTPPPRFSAFDQAWPVHGSAVPLVNDSDAFDAADAGQPALTPASIAHERGYALQHFWLMWMWLVGIVPAVALYWRGDAIAQRLLKFQPIRWLYTWLSHEMFFGELYEWTIVQPALAIVAFLIAVDRRFLHCTLHRTTGFAGHAFMRAIEWAVR